MNENEKLDVFRVHSNFKLRCNELATVKNNLEMVFIALLICICNANLSAVTMTWENNSSRFIKTV